MRGYPDFAARQQVVQMGLERGRMCARRPAPGPAHAAKLPRRHRGRRPTRARRAAARGAPADAPALMRQRQRCTARRVQPCASAPQPRASSCAAIRLRKGGRRRRGGQLGQRRRDVRQRNQRLGRLRPSADLHPAVRRRHRRCRRRDRSARRHLRQRVGVLAQALPVFRASARLAEQLAWRGGECCPG